jgi:hypothetical protein
MPDHAAAAGRVNVNSDTQGGCVDLSTGSNHRREECRS